MIPVHSSKQNYSKWNLMPNYVIENQLKFNYDECLSGVCIFIYLFLFISSYNSEHRVCMYVFIMRRVLQTWGSMYSQHSLISTELKFNNNKVLKS